MVATTKGPVNAPGGKDSTPQQRTDSDDISTRNTLELDDGTWNQLQAQAQSQQRSAADIVKQVVQNAFGTTQQAGAYHSGQPNDPALANMAPEERPALTDENPSERVENITKAMDRSKKKG
jgi:hypothetical protein